MSAVLRGERVVLASPLRQASVRVWQELPGVALVSAIAAAACLPVFAAMALGALAFAPLAVIPAAAGLSGLVQAVVPAAQGERVRVRAFARIDPVWVALAVVVSSLVLLPLAVGPTPVAIGAAGVAGAAGLLLMPLAAAYGAVRGRRGLAALRGAAVIAAVRPSVALCVAAVGVLCAFGVAATAGVLVLVLPAIHAAYAALLADRVVALVNAGADR